MQYSKRMSPLGSLAGIRGAKRHVRFTSESGHVQCNLLIFVVVVIFYGSSRSTIFRPGSRKSAIILMQMPSTRQAGSACSRSMCCVSLDLGDGLPTGTWLGIFARHTVFRNRETTRERPDAAPV